MATVFISHVEEDQKLALEIASGLERAGYSTWYYERDSSPGLSYLLQVNRAIEACHVFVLVISPRALDSVQVTAEVVRAHETGKSFVPVRTGISHEEFRRRKPEWSMAVGAAASIAVPETGTTAILPEILEGLGLLAAERERRGWHGDNASAGALRPPAASARAAGHTTRRRAWKWASAGAGALIVMLLVLYGPGRDRQKPQAGDATRSAVEPPPSVASSPAASPAPPAGPANGRAGGIDASSASPPAPNPAATIPAAAAAGRAARDRVPRCPESSARAFRRVLERGRLEARDDLNDVTYAFVICEERDTANGTVEMQIIGSSTTGTKWSGENAARKAADMDSRGTACEPTGTPPVRSSGATVRRSIVYVLCQEGGAPTSIAVHATTLKADASPYPEKVLRVAWPR